MGKYLIAYDIENHKRRIKVQKYVYSYAFGGQKSAVESILNKKEVIEIAKRVSKMINLERDRVHIIRVKEFIFLRNAKKIDFKRGDIII